MPKDVTFFLLRLKNIPIYQQLQIEEMLLRADSENWFLCNQGSPPAIVLGISSKVEELVDKRKMEAAPLPLIKRFSGGGTVVVDENTLFTTFICQKEALNVAPYPEEIHSFAAAFYHKALGISSFALKENDYTIDLKKCGGNAQYIRKNRWLHHTTFLWNYNQKRMEYLLLPKKQPTYREGRGHEPFLCTLDQHFQSKERLIEACIDELKKQYNVVVVPLKEVLQRMERAEHRKTTSFIRSFSNADPS